MKDILFQLKLKRIEKRGEKQKAKQELIDKYAPYYPSKRRKVSNVMLVVIVIAIVGYTVASFAIQYFTNIEISPTLTTAWFAFWGTELVALATIKSSKVWKEHRDEEEM